MTRSVALDVRSLTKVYPVRLRSGDTGRGSPRGRLRGLPRRAAPIEPFTALDAVSFTAHEGEVIGILGRNGAGKSTLLKILSRITDPTAGEAELFGRVGSLLEVGTGFHPELTGMENIFLNGAILGMHKAEIRRQLDAIVEFSGISSFLDTPVKRYSSGMYVRLAFAVAAHLNSEILIVDEVLAVGDREFQEKCLGKMHSVAAGGGRTVLFVSHNAGAVRSMCDRVIVLDRGKVAFDGPTVEGLRRYATSPSDPTTDGVFDLGGRLNPLGPGLPVHLRRLIIGDAAGSSPTLRTGEAAYFSVLCDGLEGVPDPFYRVHIRNELDQTVLATDSRMVGAPVGSAGATVEFRSLPLLPGSYTVDVGVGAGLGRHVLDQVERAGTFRVEDSQVYAPGYTLIPDDGSVFAPAAWTVPIAMPNSADNSSGPG